MPDRIACPSCNRTGLVRYENIIKGTQTSRLYYCGGCDFEWATAAELVSPTDKPAKGRTQIVRRSRRHSKYAVPTGAGFCEDHTSHRRALCSNT